MPLNLEEEEEEEDDEEFSRALQPELDLQQPPVMPEEDIMAMADHPAVPIEDEEQELMRQGRADEEHLEANQQHQGREEEEEEEMGGGQLQRRRGRNGGGGGHRKRRMPVQDDAVLISTHTYREWQQSSADLVAPDFRQ